MQDLLFFFLKMIVCSGILFLYYVLFLRNKKFHRYNRFYLLSAIGISLFFPLVNINIPWQGEEELQPMIIKTLRVITVEADYSEGMGATEGPVSSVFNPWLLGYILVGVVLLTFVVYSVFRVYQIRKRYRANYLEKIRFYNTSEPNAPFSFFKNIFWSKNLELESEKGQQVFRHELFHVKQRHSLDIVLIEVVCALGWINPFFHLINKELRMIHEFLADEYAVSHVDDRYAYAELLVMNAMKQHNTLPLAHSFFHPPIKRRVTMILNLHHQPRFNYLRRIMALPLFALLFCGISLKAQQILDNHKNDEIPLTSANSSGAVIRANKTIKVMVDPGHGGTDPGASLPKNPSVNEKQIALAVGKKLAELAPEYNVEIISTRTSDETVPLAQRTALMEKHQPDLVISLHLNAEPLDGKNKDGSKSGIEVFIASSDNDYLDQSKQLGSAILLETQKEYKSNPELLRRKAGIWVLDNAPSPAVIVHLGYITNSNDLAFISNPTNQEKIARSILRGLVHFSNGGIKLLPISNEGKIEFAPPKIISDENTASSDYKALLTQHNNGHDTIIDPDIAKQELDWDKIFIKTEIEASYPGGAEAWRRFLQGNMRYPAKAAENNIQGVVVVQFIVDKDGNTSDFTIANPDARLKDLEEEAIRVLKASGKWKPAIQGGRLVKSYKRQPITFKIGASGSNDKAESGDRAKVDMIFTKVEIEPSYPGGLDAWRKFLRENMIYPSEAAKNNTQGKIVVQFIVDKEGAISDVQVVESEAPGTELETEAIRLINRSGKWSPGIQNGQTVKAYRQQAITFKLSN